MNISKHDPACHVDEQILQTGKPYPKKGKALEVLRELIASDGANLDERYLARIAGTDYIPNTIASLRNMGWVITKSSRLIKGRSGRYFQRTSYTLDHSNNSITE